MEIFEQCVKTGDYSGFKRARPLPVYDNHGRLIRDEVAFGSRGDHGSGKYLRIYDKDLESNGKQNCIRWEVEFASERANLVFERLTQCADLSTFAVVCGALVGGIINFVKRGKTKNICRLEVYEFWQLIRAALGKIVVRVRRDETDEKKMREWIDRQVSPTLACLRKISGDIGFFNWVINVIGDAEERLQPQHYNVINNCRRMRGLEVVTNEALS
jgi:DNA relaxase NicK